MARIRGHYEWDDDDLVPGQKKEGGLHQNLYDSEGNLRGNARFIPDEGTEPEPLVVTENVYIPIEERRRDEDEDALQRVIDQLAAAHLIYRGLVAAKPHAEHWWRENAQPALEARRERRHRRRKRREADKQAGKEKRRKKKPAVVEATFIEHQEVLGAVDEQRPSMSRAEAQARYLAALAAQAYSDEQMRLVTRADIVDGEDLEELQRSLAELPAEQIKGVIEAMATDPSKLSEETLAELASVLGRRAL